MRLSEWASRASARYARGLEGVDETVVMEGFAGLSGRYQRIQVDPSLIDGPPPACLRVRVAVHEEPAPQSTPNQPLFKVTLKGTPLIAGSPS
jgi:succinylarginine dihydrolase